MNALYSLLSCVILGCATHLLLSRDLFRVLLGAMMLTSGANLAVVVLGRIEQRSPAFIPAELSGVRAGDVANPLPQALVLTAIVIGLGIFAFVLALIVPLARKSNTLDLDRLRPESPEGESGDPEFRE